ncbi:MAG TPA: signal peptidase II [Tepidisphaeraceae bacterium]|nr:signal peptidase II [Tepidisphaeraceae bacterium]
MTSPLSWLCFALTVAIGVTLDQWSKVCAFARLAGPPWYDSHNLIHFPTRTYAFIPGWLQFEVIPNYGAVFGVGQGKRVLFLTVSAGAILFIFYLFTVSGRQRIYQIVLGMLMAGVLGNLYDRAKFGFVRDMIHALPKWNVFPYIFNVADSLLCVGVTLMIVHSFFQSSGQGSDSRSRSAGRRR